MVTPEETDEELLEVDVADVRKETTDLVEVVVLLEVVAVL